jgi:N-acetyl-gamma-glutamyl-phosphate reductase
MVKVGIIGATGYAGAESIRLLSGHPGFEISCVVSKTFEGKRISDVYPNLSGICDLVCESLDFDKIAGKADCFITALPHAASQEAVYKLASSGKKVVDLSADYRYASVDLYEKTYGLPHAYPEMMKETVYGLPELYRKDIKGKSVIANPGCYPTCSILALAPLLANGLIDDTDITINAVSGVSGAGRKEILAYAYCEIDGNFAPYKITGHRHNSEIEEQLSAISGKQVLAGFTPHLAPFKRGMSATIYTKAKKPMSSDKLNDIYNKYYEGEFFIRIKKAGDIPSVKAVAGTNFADIMPMYDERLNRIIIVSAIDNLGKGAASQAVQNLNIMFGYNETEGLTGAGLYI